MLPLASDFRRAYILKVIFSGTPDFAATALSAILASKHSVRAVYTQPDRRGGRGQRLQHSPVKQLALNHRLPVLQPSSLKNNDAVLTDLRDHDADVMVVVAYGLILPAEVLAIPRLGCINIHASLLPRWRGAAPIQRALLAGDEQTGITIIQMDAGLDTGAMLAREAVFIEPADTGLSLHDKLANLGGRLVVDVLDRMDLAPIHGEVQDDALACYARKLDKNEAWIDWSANAEAIERQVRAFNAWPIARSLLHGQTLLVWRAEAEPHASRPHAVPGTVLDASPKGMRVAAGKGVLRILEMQMPGGRRMCAADFLNGRDFPPGTVLGGCRESVP